ncbi:hypothetical protein [Streptomyces sp. NPDC059708]|uniref:hypothetical protein n=1 Tax=Streptomyces sp. NPDC059708 TaxID=3346916 RepID=UPI00369835F4
MTNQPNIAVNQVWRSRYTTGMHVAITEVDGSRVRLVNVSVREGVATRQQGAGRGRWATTAQLTRAYMSTDLTL